MHIWKWKKMTVLWRFYWYKLWCLRRAQTIAYNYLGSNISAKVSFSDIQDILNIRTVTHWPNDCTGERIWKIGQHLAKLRAFLTQSDIVSYLIAWDVFKKAISLSARHNLSAATLNVTPDRPKAPFTRYNLLSNRLSNWLYNPVWQPVVSCKQGFIYGEFFWRNAV